MSTTKDSFELGVRSFEFWKFLTRNVKNHLNSTLNTQKLKLALVFLAAASQALAQDATTQKPSSAPFGKLELGTKYVGWSASYAAPYNGTEILTPLTLSVFPFAGAKIYAQTEFAYGSYTDSATSNTITQSLSGLSDTVLGFQATFKSFSLPSVLNVGINLPTGDSGWESRQSNSIVPTEFVDTDYRGRGLGFSFLYGMALEAGSEQYGAAVGYLYTGAFNPLYGLSAGSEQLKLGDSVFLSLNRAADHGQGQSDIIRVSAFYFLPTQLNGSNLLEMGPNINASYSWQNPKAFSFEVGGQYFLSALNNQLVTEPFNSLGPRFYFSPSYSFGDWALAGRFKYVFANGYPQDNALYTGGGFLLGLEPSYKMKLDAQSGLRFTASYDYILALQGAHDSSGNLQNIGYGRWTFGANYEVNL